MLQGHVGRILRGRQNALPGAQRRVRDGQPGPVVQPELLRGLDLPTLLLALRTEQLLGAQVRPHLL